MSISEIIITIDGEAASGKTTVSKLVSRDVGFNFLSSGEIYRYFSYLLYLEIKKNNLDISKIKTQKIMKFFKTRKIFLKGDKLIFEEGEIDLKNQEYIKYLNDISPIKKNRDSINKKIRKIVKVNRPIIIDGRDMGTVVFPKAFLKFYLVTDLKEAAKRRHKELLEKGSDDLSFSDIKYELEKRNAADRNRKYGALKKSEDANLIDTTNLNQEEVSKKIIGIIKEKLKNE